MLVGCYARSESAPEPGPEAYQAHVTGWSEAYFDRDLFPRVYELRLNDGRLARLRIDRTDDGDGFAGRLKVYATENAGIGEEGSGEDLEYDVAVVQWDGTHLVFTRLDVQQTYVAQVSGRFIKGTSVWINDTAVGAVTFSGTRAEVLTHGLAYMSPSARDDWQRRTRLQLAHLMMAGNPPPTNVAVTPMGSAMPPFVADELPPDRDDDPVSWPQHYQLTELQFDIALPGPEGGSLLRRAHGFLAKPIDPPPPGGYPVVVALNGHVSSARGLFDPSDEYYFYGDAWARHGYAVLALDISHRPLEDRSDLYDDYELGDDPEAGNGPHPAIKSPGFDTDWEENGERAWDVMRGIDYVQTLPDVNGSQIIVTGLSLGGEVASFVGALDPRVPVTVVAGFSPDFGVMLHNGSHPCWLWRYGDIREYIDTSDLHALVAPRALVVETGVQDPTFSDLPTPFASDKQVARRSRAAFADALGNFVHYLHYDQHHYHFGDVNPSWDSPADVQFPVRVEPLTSGATDWETDPDTFSGGANLFDYAGSYLAAAVP